MFGQSFNFTIFKRDKFKSSIGGVITTISFILIVIVTLLFGKDFYLKQHPKVLTSTIFPKETVAYPVNSKNFTIAYRVEDTDGVLLSNILFINPIYYSYERDSQDNWNTIVSLKLNNTLCNETEAVNNPHLSFLPLKEWYCIDWEGTDRYLHTKNLSVIMGGSWAERYVSYFEIRFDTCPLDSNKKVLYDQCIDYRRISKDLNMQQAFASFFIPSYSFNAENFTNPIQVNYLNPYFLINSNLASSVYYHFSQDQVIDDQGWIFEQLRSMTSITTSFTSTSTVYSILTESDYDNTHYMQVFSFINYFTKQNIIRSRSYMKIQDLAANVGGFIKMVLLVFQVILVFINRFFMKEALLKEFFEMKNLAKGSSIQESKSQINTNLAKGSSIQESKSQINTKSVCRVMLDNNYINQVEDYKAYREQRVKEYQYSLYDFTKSILCKCVLSSVDKNNREKHELAKKIFNERVDLQYYMRSMKEFDTFKSIFLNSDQRKAFEYQCKYNLENTKDVEFLLNSQPLNSKQEKEENRRLLQYYIKNINDGALNEIDKNIFKAKDDCFKEYVVSKCNNSIIN
jgi:hypothetical protein